MSKNVQERVSEVISFEVLKRLSTHGICIIVQSGASEFSFIPKEVVTIDLVEIAKILIGNGCSDDQIEKILGKIEGETNVRR